MAEVTGAGRPRRVAWVALAALASGCSLQEMLHRPEVVPPRWQLYGAIYVSHRAALAVWFALAVVVALVWLLAPALAPWILRAPPAANGPALWRTRGPVIAVSALAIAVMASLDALSRGDAWPHFHDEAVGFMTVAEVCAHGVRCPLVGQPMLYGIHLGPAFYQVLSLVHLASDPRTAFFLLLQAQVVVAVVLLGLAAHAALDGGPWGLAAGASLYFSETFRWQLFSPEHSTLAILPGAGFVYAALSFSRHQRRRDFVVANLCLCIAVQMYGILFPFVVSLAVLGLIGRAPARAWLLSGVVWFVAFAPWLLFEVRTRAHELTHTFGYEGAFTLTGGAGQVDRSVFDRDLWPLGVLGLLYAATVAARRTAPAPDRRAALGIFVLGLTAFGTCWLGRARWTTHYSLILQLGLAASFAAAPCAIWRETARLLGARAVAARWRPAALSCAVAAIAWLLGPLAGRVVFKSSALVFRHPMDDASNPTHFVSFSEQVQLGALLSSRGFGPVEIEEHVHGALWDRLAGPGWLSDARSARGATRDRSRHALILSHCVPPSDDFVFVPASWTMFGRLGVALYAPRLALASADLDLADGTRLHGPMPLPFVSRPTNYLFRDPIEAREQLGRALPAFHLTPEARRFLEVWRRQAPGALIMHATMRPGNHERLLVVVHDLRLPVTVRAGGADVPVLDRQLTFTGAVEHTSYRVGNVPGDLAIDITVARPDGAFPADVDLYETPFPRCTP